MKLFKKPTIQNAEYLKSKDRFTFIADDHDKLVVPVGPRFQADVPPWTCSFSRRSYPTVDIESDNLKWLGIRVWPVGVKCQVMDDSAVAQGRSEVCDCAFPGSIECVRQHVADKRIKLKCDLGPVYWKWRFDKMGEDVCRLWTQEDSKRFEYVVKINAAQQKNFIKSAMEFFSCKSKECIVSYYLNVYIPRRFALQSRAGCTTIDTDEDTGDTPRPMGSPRKRCHAKKVPSKSSKYIRTAYLTSRR